MPCPVYLRWVAITCCDHEIRYRHHCSRRRTGCQNVFAPEKQERAPLGCHLLCLIYALPDNSVSFILLFSVRGGCTLSSVEDDFLVLRVVKLVSIVGFSSRSSHLDIRLWNELTPVTMCDILEKTPKTMGTAETSLGGCGKSFRCDSSRSSH